MTIIRTIRTEQGHAVPSMAYAPRGIFDPSVTHVDTPVKGNPDLDEMGQEHELGGTAQNGYRALRWFQCNNCGAIINEHETTTHTC